MSARVQLARPAVTIRCLAVMFLVHVVAWGLFVYVILVTVPAAENAFANYAVRLPERVEIAIKLSFLVNDYSMTPVGIGALAVFAAADAGLLALLRTIGVRRGWFITLAVVLALPPMIAAWLFADGAWRAIAQIPV